MIVNLAPGAGPRLRRVVGKRLAGACRGLLLGVQVPVELYQADNSVHILSDQRNVLHGIKVLLNSRRLFRQRQSESEAS
jgi:hypothetical protein